VVGVHSFIGGPTAANLHSHFPFLLSVFFFHGVFELSFCLGRRIVDLPEFWRV
jgi:hypothetical protein